MKRGWSAVILCGLISSLSVGHVFSEEVLTENETVVVESQLVEPEKTEYEKKLDNIRKFMLITGSGERGKKIIIEMIETFRSSDTDVPQSFWEEFMTDISIDELINMHIPIYDKYLTFEEIEEIVRFYQSPVGKKFILVLPQIMQESLVVEQQWSIAVAQKVEMLLHQKGF